MSYHMLLVYIQAAAHSPGCNKELILSAPKRILTLCIFSENFASVLFVSDFAVFFEVCSRFDAASASACFTTTDRSGEGGSSTHTCTGEGEHTSTLTHLEDSRSWRGGIPFLVAGWRAGARTATQKRVFSSPNKTQGYALKRAVMPLT